jgi:hypothetical protein
LTLPKSGVAYFQQGRKEPQMQATIGQYTSKNRQDFNGTYTNKDGSRVFQAEDNWLVCADGFTRRTDWYYFGKLFVNGELVDAEYEISERRLNQWFSRKVGA